MDFGEICKVDQWLKFSAGTCFGETKNHLGVFVAISDELAICIAINATSNVGGVKDFAQRRQIDANETVVVIEPDAPAAAHHFSKETAFDCNRPAVVTHAELAKWIARRQIELVDYNVAVNDELLARIKAGILSSPLVANKYKKIILDS